MSETYKIKEVAQKLGISSSAIRFYERKGLFSVSKNEENGYRTFTDDDVYKLWSISYHRSLDMSVSDIYRLKHSDSLESINEMVRGQERETMARIEKETRRLGFWRYYKRMLEKAARWDQPPRRVESGDLHLFRIDSFYDRQRSTFTVANPFSLRGGESDSRGWPSLSVCMIYDEDIGCVAPEDRSLECDLIPSFETVAVTVRVPGDFDNEAAASLARSRAAEYGFDVEFPCYVSYILSTGDWEHPVRYYEVFLMPKGE